MHIFKHKRAKTCTILLNRQNDCMNQQVADLYKIAGRDRRLIIGLMSGTSVDGLDIAICEFSGHGMDTQIELKHFATISYDEPAYPARS